MVAYNFKARFESPILTRRKSGTIRSIGKKRHARPGEVIQLYAGSRFRPQLMATATCTDVIAISLTFSQPGVWLGHPINGAPVIGLDDFARGDGFADWQDMAEFWRGTHGKRLGPWTGLWIRWDPDSVRTP